ncbi:MAG: carbamoyl-phosphate synthase large subunit [Desulfovibrio sp.]|jgi:carbamoyl-phosphate synthase large subunit|nr:carbamoyl-phosphate synthase large subunit [Desulfovibrio sp.]
MPRLDEIRTVMVLGSGPIVIGQACEFDYSGTQGCKALREEGCRIILLNSNPATVMTDPGFSDRTYIEPLNLHMASAVIRREKPDALLPTLGGQTALNLAMELHASGVLRECGVRMIGARPEAIELAENRRMFRETMRDIGLDLPESGLASTVQEAVDIALAMGFPAIVRPSYTLGGTGGGVAFNLEEFKEIARHGLESSPIGQILVEESVLGWKELELEVVRDTADNAIVICGIENFDPMGVHTGDSITVAPIQTLSDVEYQALRNDALAVVRAVGVDTGGCNIQFAVDPKSGRRVIIEMNPRVSRSSALASKATGFPIARVAAKLALGYRLDELRNDITGTSACFEPTIDYCVVKVPRFNFEKFWGSEPVLGLQMHSVGETMALGGNFREALQKALRGLEVGLDGLEVWNSSASGTTIKAERLAALKQLIHRAGPERLPQLYEALDLGLDVDEARAITGIDPWFLHQLLQILEAEKSVAKEFAPLAAMFFKTHQYPHRPEPPYLEEGGGSRCAYDAFVRHLAFVKAQGFSDARIAVLLEKAFREGAAGDGEIMFQAVTEERVRAMRLSAGIRPAYRSVDTCAGEFAALTPYFYSTHDIDRNREHITGPEQADGNAGVSFSSRASLPGGLCSDPALAEVLTAERAPSASRKKGSSAAGRGKSGREASGSVALRRPLPRKVMILGGGPNRIGQGIEFDYCCVQAAFALRDLGITAVMVNSNPETVSTDYDAVDRLYFEPVTAEDILAICEVEQPDGVIVQFGGQTPLNLAETLAREGIPILGTQPEGIARAEDREAFGALVDRLGIPQPPSGMANNEESVCRVAKEIGYPVMVRPSFVLGGKAMRIIHNEPELRAYVCGKLTGHSLDPGSPILVDKFLEDAVEVDVDAIVDGEDVTIAAVMEHIEQAGIHSGDSCCSIPTHTLGAAPLERIRRFTRELGIALGTVGLLNVQFAIRDGEVSVIEANPRASRTVPFVSKATGLNIAGMAARVMAGLTLRALGFTEEPALRYHAVKEAVIPFERFPGTEISLGPEMRSTGEVMGIDRSFGMAFLKAQSAAGAPVPYSGNVVLSVSDRDKHALAPLASRLADLGFRLYATPGTGEVLAKSGILTEPIVKIGPQRPHLLDFMRNGQAQIIVNTVSGPASARDATVIRAEALSRRSALFTTIAALRAAVEGLEARRKYTRSVAPLQDYYAGCVEGETLP